jgi:DNA gyrase subunit A
MPDEGGSQQQTFGVVEPIEIQEEMERSFLEYAMSVITARALPDARDGLKPVHRRILYGMYEQTLRPDRNRKKCASAVGDVMAKYHPHGDTAIYDALARMAQDFSLRYPLVDGKGNFGSPDPNDRPAAMRYTECRLSPLAMRLLGEIDEETVDFTPNYDGSNEEPLVLPARYPNLLVNGGGGIAVGMATNIPPHNLREVIDATVHLIEHPDATPDDLMQFVHGPDFPTGATILGRSGTIEAYRTGRGSIRMRAVAEIEDMRNGRQRIVVTQIPYQTSVEVIGSKIAELVEERRIEGVSDVKNTSSGVTVRLEIELKRDANAQVVLNQLYKNTPMQSNFAVNMLALVDGVPRLLNLAQALTVYIAHQVEVVTRRSEFRLRKAQARIHILEGLLRALDMIDAVIALIRGSADVETARAGLMAEPFSFSEVQANYILDMALRRLTALEGQKLREERDQLATEIAELEAILASPERLRSVIKDELLEVRDEFGDERRTQLVHDPGEIDILDLIDDEDVIVMLSKGGYIKSVKGDTFRSQGRGGRGITGAKLREEDYVEHLLTTTAHAYLLFFSNRGRVYRIRAHEIPILERTARGTALVNLIPLAPEEHIQAIIDTRTYEDAAYLFFATKGGIVKKTRMSDYDSSLRAGLIAVKLRDGDELVRVVQTRGTDDIFMVSGSGMTVCFNEDEVRSMGRDATGVIGMKLKDGEPIVSCDVVRSDQEILFVTTNGYGKRTPVDRFPRHHRGGQGVRGIRVTEARGAVAAAFVVAEEDEILVFSSGGNVVRVPVAEISSQGRDATGVRIARVEDGEEVVAAAPVLDSDEDPAEDGNGDQDLDSGEGGD